MGLQIPNRESMLVNERCYSYISTHLTGFLCELGVDRKSISGLGQEIINIARVEQSDDIYEAMVHSLLERVVPTECREKALATRAERIFKQVSPHLRQGRTLDFGCGDAKVAKLLQEHQGGVTLADTYLHPEAEKLSLPFYLLTQDGICPAESNSFDNVLVITVLHHCVNPAAMLDDIIRLTKRRGRLLIIESVYVEQTELLENGDADSATIGFLSLSTSEQIAVTAFFDHLYNRCLFYSERKNLKISTPYNYMTPEILTGGLEQRGLVVEPTIHLGLDQPIAPLFHVLCVAVKER